MLLPIVLDGQDFEGDRAVQVDVLGLVDDAHAARADALDDAVVAEHQAEGLAGEQAAELEFVDPTLADQGVDQPRAVSLVQAGVCPQEGVQLGRGKQAAFGEIMEEFGGRRHGLLGHSDRERVDDLPVPCAFHERLLSGANPAVAARAAAGDGSGRTGEPRLNRRRGASV